MHYLSCLPRAGAVPQCDHDDFGAAAETLYHKVEHACEKSVCSNVNSTYDGKTCGASTKTAAPTTAPPTTAGGHGHAHGASCACEAAEADHPFTINCADTAAIATAETKLKTCAKTTAACDAAVGGVKLCLQAFFVMQAHKSYCPHDTLTSAQETTVHDYEPCVSMAPPCFDDSRSTHEHP